MPSEVGFPITMLPLHVIAPPVHGRPPRDPALGLVENEATEAPRRDQGGFDATATE